MSDYNINIGIGVFILKDECQNVGKGTKGMGEGTNQPRKLVVRR